MHNSGITTLRALLSSLPVPAPLPNRPQDFPLEALLPTVRLYVERAAAEARVPVGAIAAPLLALTGGTIGSQLSLQVAPGWIERPVLWITLIGSSGSGKTPAIRAARAPLDHLRSSRYQQTQNAASSAIERSVPVVSAPSSRRYQQTSVSAAEDPIYTTVSTISDLLPILARQPGITLIRDELFGIVRQMRRRGGDERQRFLSLWSSEPITPATMDTPAPLIATPVVSLVGGLQPLYVPKVRSAEQDGFIERFLPIYLPLQQPYWADVSHSFTASADPAPVADLLRQLRSIRTSPDRPGGLTISLSPEATAIWARWYNDNVDQMIALPLTARGFAAKLPSHVARLALVLHALWHPANLDQPLTADTMTRATCLGEFFRSHIALTLHLLNEHRGPVTPTLRNRVRRTLAEHSGWLTRTQLRDQVGKPPAGDLDTVVTQLRDAGTIETRTRREPTARRPITEYRLTRRH